MKIQVIAPHAFYVDRGTPICLDYLLRSMSERGDEVHVCVYDEGEPRDYPGVTIHRSSPPKWLGSIGPGFSFKKLVADAYLFKTVRKVRREVKPDVVHAGEEAVFMAMLFKRLYRLPYVYDLDSSIAQQTVEKVKWFRPLAWMLNWFEGRAIKKAMACAPVCNALADLAKERGARHVVTMHDISQLSDPDREATGFLREQLGLPADRPILMYVGNLEKYQGVDLLIEGYQQALMAGADVELVIAGGTDEDIEKYQHKLDDLKLDGRVHLLGRWPAAKLDELLAEADILTAPRIRGINTPQKIFPYMHSGRPVLLTDLHTHTQVLDSSVAYLAPAEPQGFGKAILALANDPQRRAKLGEAGRAFVEANHTYSAHCDRVAMLYDWVGEQLQLAGNNSSDQTPSAAPSPSGTPVDSTGIACASTQQGTPA